MKYEHLSNRLCVDMTNDKQEIRLEITLGRKCDGEPYITNAI